MKKILAVLLLVILGSPAYADHHENDGAMGTNASEPISATAKKRLRHVGQNVEKLGKKAGKKLGVKNVSDSSGATPVEHPADHK